jgi:hypothetical protein
MRKKTIPARLMPRDLREVADVALDDADSFYRHWLDAERQALVTVEKQFDQARVGADAVAKKALAFAAQNLTTSFEFAHKLMWAKDPGEFVRLQIDFYQRQSAAFAGQMRDLGEAMAKGSAAGSATRDRSQPDWPAAASPLKRTGMRR